MKNYNECENIRGRIEESILGNDTRHSERIHEHVQSCRDCKDYLTGLEALHGTSRLRYSLQAYERMNFSAKVRTRIEEKKTAQRHRGFITRPAFQIAAMIVIVISVALYMIHTEPEPVFVFDEESIELLDTYSLFFDDILIPEDAVIADLYHETLFGDDIYLNDVWNPGFYDDEYYYDIDDLSPEEIDYIIQRLEEV